MNPYKNHCTHTVVYFLECLYDTARTYFIKNS